MNLHDKTQLKMTESDNDKMRRLIIRFAYLNYIYEITLINMKISY